MSDIDIMTLARETMRERYADSPIYTAGIGAFIDHVKTLAPDIDLSDGAKMLLAAGLHLVATDTCDHICTHRLGESLITLADRMLLDAELEASTK